MDYKKKYEEVLERGTRLLESGTITLEDYEYMFMFPKIKESEDEKIRKEMIEILRKEAQEFPSSVIAEKSNSWIAWLEKQCEQKPASNVELKWNKGNDGEFLYETSIVWLHNETKTLATAGLRLDSNTFYIPISELEKLPKEEFENQGEQKPTDKVEPKFKIGDWIVTPDNEVKQIEKVTFGNYWFTDKSLYAIINVDNRGHLWTIRDAKDGDILACDKIVLIVNHIGNFEGESIIYSWYFSDSNTFYGMGPKDPDRWNIEGFHPATQEQRDLLFSKIKESGYEWDSEKKELKKN